MSCERVLNFDQWKIFSENYKPMRVWLWLVYRFTENNCRLRLFPEFIQTQKRYPTSPDKISMLTWKLLVISSQIFSSEPNSQRTYCSQNISYLSLRLYVFSVNFAKLVRTGFIKKTAGTLKIRKDKEQHKKLRWKWD